MSNKCNICDREVDVNNGGAALMLAFCHNHTTNLINVSVCKECYYMFLEKPMKLLKENVGLNIDFNEVQE